MAVNLYLSFSGSAWYGWIFAIALAVSLELAKILTWRAKGIYRAVSVALSLLTLLSITGTTLNSIQVRKAHSLQARLSTLTESRNYQDILGHQKIVQDQQGAILKRMNEIPADWVSLSIKLNDEAKVLTSEGQDLSQKLAELEQQAEAGATSLEPTIFSALGSLSGVDESKVELIVLLFLAVAIEVSAFALVGSGHGNQAVVLTNTQRIRKPDSQSQIAQTKQTDSGTEPVKAPVQVTQPSGATVTSEDYLTTAVSDSPKKPYLLGRQKVSERLGITETEAKGFLEELLSQGKIARSGKYFISV